MGRRYRPLGEVPRREHCDAAPVTPPPDGLLTYRVLTGPDDESFCRRVSEALALGYRLHEGPSLTAST
jgi:hypothetical protein